MTVCPRSHADLKYRNPNIPVEDLPLSMQNAYKDAVERGCGHTYVPRTIPIRKEDMMDETQTQEPTDSEPKATVKVARKPKTCSVCSEQGHNKRTHGRRTVGQPVEAPVEG